MAGHHSWLPYQGGTNFCLERPAARAAVAHERESSDSSRATIISVVEWKGQKREKRSLLMGGLVCGLVSGVGWVRGWDDRVEPKAFCLFWLSMAVGER
jgi:hypothetical protein